MVWCGDDVCGMVLMFVVWCIDVNPKVLVSIERVLMSTFVVRSKK